MRPTARRRILLLAISLWLGSGSIGTWALIASPGRGQMRLALLAALVLAGVVLCLVSETTRPDAGRKARRPDPFARRSLLAASALWAAALPVAVWLVRRAATPEEPAWTRQPYVDKRWILVLYWATVLAVLWLPPVIGWLLRRVGGRPGEERAPDRGASLDGSLAAAQVRAAHRARARGLDRGLRPALEHRVVEPDRESPRDRPLGRPASHPCGLPSLRGPRIGELRPRGPGLDLRVHAGHGPVLRVRLSRVLRPVAVGRRVPLLRDLAAGPPGPFRGARHPGHVRRLAGCRLELDRRRLPRRVLRLGEPAAQHRHPGPLVRSLCAGPLRPRRGPQPVGGPAGRPLLGRPGLLRAGEPLRWPPDRRHPARHRRGRTPARHAGRPRGAGVPARPDSRWSGSRSFRSTCGTASSPRSCTTTSSFPTAS